MEYIHNDLYILKTKNRLSRNVIISIGLIMILIYILFNGTVGARFYKM